MRQLSLDALQDSKLAIASTLSPSGHITVYLNPDETGVMVSKAVHQRIDEAFSRGRGAGVLHLGAAEVGTTLDPSLGFWRDVGQALVAKVCGAIDPSQENGTQTLGKIVPSAEELKQFADSVPPMLGAEFVTEFLLHDIWAEAQTALQEEAKHFSDGVQGFLKSKNSLWNVVGRVCFHLAENKRDPEYPFAFIATYAHRLSRQAKLQHLPLNRALKEYAGERNREKLVALLTPIVRAKERSSFISELVDSGDIYHPLSWDAEQAHRFLCEIAVYEQSGVVVRVPDWWSAKNRPRPKVTVSVGGKPASRVGMAEMLDFDVGLTLGGETLTPQEIEQLLSASEGLVLIKGKWVEVDREKLTAVLERWRLLQHQTQREGISFGEALRLLAGADLDDQNIDEEDDAALSWSEVVAGKWLSEKLASLRSPEVSREIEEGAHLRATLRPYQKSGVAWLWTLRELTLGGCLADDMGLGKTIQVLAVLAMSQKRKEEGVFLLVVPASLLDNWKLELERFAPQLKLLVAHPSRMPANRLKTLSTAEVEKHDAVITTYGTVMRLPWIQDAHWRGVILDEAQAIKNPGTKQTRAVKTIKSEWRLALTGTPVENKLGDLWSIFDFLNPGLLGSAKTFNNYCKTLAARKQGGFAPLRRLVSPYILRRLKTDKRVIDDLPDKTEVTAYCLLSKRQAVLYQQAVDELKRAIKNLAGIERRGVVLAYLMRFKQICNHPSHWLGDQNYQAKESGKFTRLAEICESIASRQDKVLIFSQFKEMTGPLMTFLSDIFGKPGLVLHGGTPVKNRQAMVKRFQESETVPYMVLSLKAGGTGLNLTAASHVIHFDRWWNPAVENQATDRAFRIGQKKNVLVHKFVCRGTVEERIDGMIAEKKRLSEEILSAGVESSLTEMNDKELLELVSLDIKSALDTKII